MRKPLEGLTILDFTRVYSGPYATLLLADMGAEVIKVEHPQHGDDSRAFGPLVDGASGYFETLNRGKLSIALDHRTPEGQCIVRQLAAQVDVLIENFRPGAMASHGLDYDSLKRDCPRLIYTSISGFGQFGPYAHLGCYDVVAQAMSGLMSLTGLPELPLKTGPAIADAITGLTAAVGLLGALWGRERTGKGAHIDVAMVDSVFACLENALPDYTATGQLQPRQGNIDSALAPFDSFATIDGWIVIGVGNDRIWQSLASLIDLGNDLRFATNADRLENYAVLRPFLAAWCASKTVDALLNQLHAVGVPSGPIRSMAELAVDPQLEARGMLLRSADTSMLVPGSPIHIDGIKRTSVAQRAPHLGEHTTMIFERYGL